MSFTSRFFFICEKCPTFTKVQIQKYIVQEILLCFSSREDYILRCNIVSSDFPSYIQLSLSLMTKYCLLHFPSSVCTFPNQHNFRSCVISMSPIFSSHFGLSLLLTIKHCVLNFLQYFVTLSDCQSTSKSKAYDFNVTDTQVTSLFTHYLLFDSCGRYVTYNLRHNP